MSGLPNNTDTKELNEFFKDLNPVWSFVSYGKGQTRVTQRFYRYVYGFVKFKDTETQQKAISEYTDKPFGPRKIRVTSAKERVPGNEKAEKPEGITEEADISTETKA